jgi:hypothetical protein
MSLFGGKATETPVPCGWRATFRRFAAIHDTGRVVFATPLHVSVAAGRTDGYQTRNHPAAVNVDIDDEGRTVSLF